MIAFLFTQVIALFIGAQFLHQEVSIVEDPSDPMNSIYLFAYIMVATAFLIILLKYYKGKKLFKGMELFLEFYAIYLLVGFAISEIVGLVVAVALISVRVFVPITRNAFLLLATAVVGALLGASFDVLPVALFASLLAAYDVFAVFYSGHMVMLAKKLKNRGAAFAISFKHAKESIHLGTGDVVIPAMISVSALRLSQSMLPGFVAMAGALAGLLAMIFILEKKKGYWPALPPLVFGALSAIALYVGISTLLA